MALFLVDLGRIELPPPQCECGVLPLNHKPVPSLRSVKFKIQNSKFKIILSERLDSHQRSPRPERGALNCYATLREFSIFHFQFLIFYVTQYFFLVISSCLVSIFSLSFLAFCANIFSSFSDNSPNLLISFSKNSFLFFSGSSKT